MAKRKTTIAIDEELLRTAKVFAARHDLRDSDVFEQALRGFLGLDLLDEVWRRNAHLDGDQIMREADEELHAMRAQRPR